MALLHQPAHTLHSYCRRPVYTGADYIHFNSFGLCWGATVPTMHVGILWSRLPPLPSPASCPVVLAQDPGSFHGSGSLSSGSSADSWLNWVSHGPTVPTMHLGTLRSRPPRLSHTPRCLPRQCYNGSSRVLGCFCTVLCHFPPSECSSRLLLPGSKCLLPIQGSYPLIYAPLRLLLQGDRVGLEIR